MQLCDQGEAQLGWPGDGWSASPSVERRQHEDANSARTLVTGATGLLGQHLVRQLSNRGYLVRVLVRSAAQRCYFPEIVEVVTGDIRNAKDVDAAVAGCRYVLHTCSTHVYNLPAEEMWAVNVDGTQNVCDAVEKNKCDKLVFTSTASTLRSPDALPKLDASMSPRQRNSTNKKVAEQLILNLASRGFPAVVVNPSFFIGPFDYSPSPFRLWIPLAIIRPVRFVPSGGYNVVSASDVARAHIWALENGKAGERYPVVGENISLQGFVSIVNCATGRPLAPKLISDRALRLVARGRVFDAYVAKLLTRSNYVDADCCYPFNRQSLVEVVDATVRWFRACSPLIRSGAMLRYIWEKYV